MGVIVMVGASAAAQPTGEKPWAKNVPEDKQKLALALYKEGNGEFTESRYAQALTKYRAALEHWDHPAIRFNMAVSLINLEEPLEAFEHLESALRFGEDPLGGELHAQGLTYKKLLLGRLAKLEVSCDEAGADVTLDGKLFVKGPGKASRFVMPGDHQLVTSKPGFLTETTQLVLMPGKDTTHAVKLRTLEDAKTKLVRRWKSRTPWVVVGIGGGTAALGAIALYLSKQEFATYDQLVKAQCPCPPGTPPDNSYETRGRIMNVTGVSLLAVGGAFVVGGLIGVYLNVPKRVVERVPVITPTISKQVAGASVRWSF